MGKLFSWFFNKFKGLVGEIFAQLGLTGTRRLAKMATVMGAILATVAAFVAFQVATVALMRSLIYIPDSPQLQTAVYIILPDNAPACIAALATTLIARFALAWTFWKLHEIRRSGVFGGEGSGGLL